MAGYYYVETETALVTCRARGKLKLEEVTPTVGDRVRCNLLPDGAGVIQDVLPRRSLLQRPAVSNVDQVLIVATLREPSPNLGLVDRLLVTAEFLGLGAIVGFNKSDLGSQDEADALWNIYQPLGYSSLVFSAKQMVGIDRLRDLLNDRVTVMAGQSGVGKSSLINLVTVGKRSATGEVSVKSGTGRHTTRHVELLPLPTPWRGFVVDTPGFNRLELPEGLTADQLDACFPEMHMRGDCRFSNSCAHLAEPDCAVKAALEQQQIAPSRYHSYQLLYQELREAERRY